MIKRVQYWFGLAWPEPWPTDVLLRGEYFTSAWLARNDYLSCLQIDRLILDSGCPATGDDVKAIIERHPLKSLQAWSIRNADSVARGDWQAGDVEKVDLVRSDLTDDGLRDLPLERIVSLKVFGTRVTAQGLQDLSRCSRLVELTLDGRQFDASVVTVLNSLPTFSGLYLAGPEVTDDHVRLLYSLPRVDGVMIEGTSATREAIAEYAKARPDSYLEVDGAPFEEDSAIDGIETDNSK